VTVLGLAAAGFCVHGNEPSLAVKGGEFFEWLSDYKFLD
jgi:hypothetical protein